MVVIDSGIGPDNDISAGKALAITAFTAVALYNVIELTFIIFVTFKRKSGLYFISFCVATVSNFGVLSSPFQACLMSGYMRLRLSAHET